MLDQQTPETTNRYANDWNRYSAEWDGSYGRRYQHLGDEWHDDGTGRRTFEDRLFAHTIQPWLAAGQRVLEIGPGGGKWTVRMAPHVGALTVFDVSQGMLDRTRARVEGDGLANVSYVLGNGRDLAPIPSGSVDLVFSYDVFVHIALEDTVAYVAEIARVLRDGGLAIVHHAVADVGRGWDRIEEHNDWYRERPHTLGQFYYYSQDALDRLYARQGLRVEAWQGYYCTTTVTVVKPGDSVVPRLEQSLRAAAVAADDTALEMAIDDIQATGSSLARRLDALTDTLRRTTSGAERYQVIQQIRRLFRG
jgi:ubiquinone/menaquinone biosynthesis C-methylase UbiE